MNKSTFLVIIYFQLFTFLVKLLSSKRLPMYVKLCLFCQHLVSCDTEEVLHHLGQVLMDERTEGDEWVLQLFCEQDDALIAVMHSLLSVYLTAFKKRYLPKASLITCFFAF